MVVVPALQARVAWAGLRLVVTVVLTYVHIHSVRASLFTLMPQQEAVGVAAAAAVHEGLAHACLSLVVPRLEVRVALPANWRLTARVHVVAPRRQIVTMFVTLLTMMLVTMLMFVTMMLVTMLPVMMRGLNTSASHLCHS